ALITKATATETLTRITRITTAMITSGALLFLISGETGWIGEGTGAIGAEGVVGVTSGDCGITGGCSIWFPVSTSKAKTSREIFW
ncbi:MAG: hypothetical protein AAB887_01360, partial [Patescibacteria group bacterium]